MSIKIGILLSGLHGRGSNMQAIADNCVNRNIDGTVSVAIGNYRNSPALARAQSLSIPTEAIKTPHDGDPITAGSYGTALLQALERYDVDLVCLSGYMLKLPSNVIDRYSGRIMNIHNGLLPAFGGKGMYGMRVHKAVIDYGAKISGCTVHFVDDGYDTGPIILQSVVPVEDDDTPEDLAARVLIEEHKSFSLAISLFAQGRLKIEGRRVRILNGA
jgi:formyltetrahydrofolate-dependent phosphoribosylglycinamide formyltransferase